MTAALLQLEIEMSERGKPAREFRVRRRTGRAARIEIAAAEEVRSRDYRGSHGPVFIRALRARKITIDPEIKTHGAIQAWPCHGKRSATEAPGVMS